MDIRVELLKEEIAQMIKDKVCDLDIDANEIIHSQSSKILEEIVGIVRDTDLTDFMAMDRIVEVLIRYDIDTGVRHDF